MFHDLIWSSVQPAFRNLIVSGGRNAALLFVGLSAGGIIAARESSHSWSSSVCFRG